MTQIRGRRGAAPRRRSSGSAGGPTSSRRSCSSIARRGTWTPAPLYATHAGDGSGRLFVVEKRGTIAIARDGQRLAAPFLDITALVGSSGSEQGLLSVAFHPHYATNGLFFVDYTDKQGNTVVARYTVSADPDAADPRSAKVLLHIDQPYANHNGGLVRFGPDGYLYVGMGDGGSEGDPQGNGQNTNILLGKLLRIDVDHGDPYAIPPDNPFADGVVGRPEVWADGLRNPWRFAFDPPRGLLFIGDVGQDAYEEIDAQPASRGGVNYGWKRMEGQHCYPASAACDRDGLALPVAEYGHAAGCSVTGGEVYRGKAYPQMTGLYFFGDYCSGRIWALDQVDGGAWRTTEVLQSGIQISSFGADEAGELYVTGLGDGTLYRLAA